MRRNQTEVKAAEPDGPVAPPTEQQAPYQESMLKLADTVRYLLYAFLFIYYVLPLVLFVLYVVAAILYEPRPLPESYGVTGPGLRHRLYSTD